MLLSELPVKESGIFSIWVFSLYKNTASGPVDFNITGKHTGAKKSNVTNLV